MWLESCSILFLSSQLDLVVPLALQKTYRSFEFLKFFSFSLHFQVSHQLLTKCDCVFIRIHLIPIVVRPFGYSPTSHCKSLQVTTSQQQPLQIHSTGPDDRFDRAASSWSYSPNSFSKWKAAESRLLLLCSLNLMNLRLNTNSLDDRVGTCRLRKILSCSAQVLALRKFGEKQ